MTNQPGNADGSTTGPDLPQLVSQDDFRQLMSRVASPVSVMTTMAEDGPRGTTVSAFTSLSMDPPMVMGALDRGSELLQVIAQSARFGLNVLSAHQPDVALAFASKLGAEKFTDMDWHLHQGVPRLIGAPGWLVCDVADLLPGGDHVIVVGKVRWAETAHAQPLIYHDRRFGTEVFPLFWTPD